MVPDVIVLNGGSSSGKSSLARELQAVLPGLWLRFSVDTLIEACPPQVLAEGGLHFGPGGAISVGSEFTRVEQYWMTGIASMARAGAHIVIEDSFLSGPAAQRRWRSALDGLDVAWIGVRLSAERAARREARRGDREPGMAAAQAASVHRDIDYDLEIDTGSGTPAELATTLADGIAAITVETSPTDAERRRHP